MVDAPICPKGLVLDRGKMTGTNLEVLTITDGTVVPPQKGLTTLGKIVKVILANSKAKGSSILPVLAVQKQSGEDFFTSKRRR
jgi:hypothetical protein